MISRVDVAGRLKRLEALSTPSGLLLQPWDLDEGGAVTRYGEEEWRQQDAEGLDAFLDRAGDCIGRAPLVWLSPLDVAL